MLPRPTIEAFDHHLATLGLRLEAVVIGCSALVLTTLGRGDLIKTKLFALCDRGIDLLDCVALAPTVAELDEAVLWLAEQDANPGWPAHVGATIADLSRRLGHGV